MLCIQVHRDSCTHRRHSAHTARDERDFLANRDARNEPVQRSNIIDQIDRRAAKSATKASAFLSTRAALFPCDDERQYRWLASGAHRVHVAYTVCIYMYTRVVKVLLINRLPYEPHTTYHLHVLVTCTYPVLYILQLHVCIDNTCTF